MTFLNNVWSKSFIKLFSLREYKILLLLLFCIIIFSNAEIISSSDPNLKRILSIETKTYEAVEKFGEVEKVKLNGVIKEKFNENGDLMERLIHDADTNDNIIYGNKTVVLNYNDKRKIKDINEYSLDGILIGRIIFQYDDKGKLKEEKDYYYDGSKKTKKTYKYDALGNLLGWGTEYFAQPENLPIETYIFTEEDVKYFAKGNVEEIKYNNNQKTIYKYDSKGNLSEQFEITKREYENESDSSASIYPVKKKIKFFYDTLISTYKYDDKNNVIEYEVPANKWTYKYYFDENGNWIKRIQFNDGEPDEIKERIIVYY
jgi:hypothetical protein